MSGRAIILLATPEDPEDPGVRQVLEQAQASGAQVHTALGIEAAVALARGPAGQPLDTVIIVGPTVPHPLKAGRQLRAAGADAAFLFAVPVAQEVHLRQQLFYAGPTGARWSLQRCDDPHLARTIREMLQATAQQRRLRTTLDRMNLRLSSPAPLDGAHYRRLIISDHYLASILTHAQDAIISLASAGTVLTWNRGAERLFGICESHALGQPITALLPGIASLGDAIGRASIGEVIRQELQRVGADRTSFLDATLTPVRGEGQQIIGIAAIIRDVTEARSADRRKDEFLAVLAHELRNPLAPIRNGLQILRRSAAADPLVQRTGEMMERQLSHLVRLVDDLLDISRITRGKVELRRERLLLHEVLASALESCRVLLEPQGHETIVHMGTEALAVAGDVDRLIQVFANLLTNAAKFTTRPGRIWLTLAREGCEAVVTVRDSGVGIPLEALERVFEPFTQLHPHGQGGGLGIGLALVRQLVQLHGGSVSAHSAGPGQGSTFTVRLPLAEDHGATGPHPAVPGGTAATANRQRVLVADDNVDAAASLAQLLELDGHQVAVARDGREAVALAESFRPEVIFMDLGMPEMDGVEAASCIRARPWGRRMRIVALTGWGREADRVRTRQAGFDEHLVKPVSPAALAQVLAGEAQPRG